MITDPSHRHDTITAAALAVLVGLAGVGALLNALLDATGHPLFTALGLVAAAALVGTGRGVARRVRERREDAADLLAGAAWRAKRMPHLSAQIERDRAGVA